MEEACVMLSNSQKKIHDIKHIANESHTESHEYDKILDVCSTHVNELLNLLKIMAVNSSFIAQKKCREMRLLLIRWKRLQEEISDSRNNSIILENLLCDSTKLKEVLEKCNIDIFSKSFFK